MKKVALRFIAILFLSFLLVPLFGCMVVTDEVEVELREWGVNAKPATVKSGRSFFIQFGFQRIVFKITNTGALTHEFAVTETKFAPDNLPLERGRVRYYTYDDEPPMIFGGQAIPIISRTASPDFIAELKMNLSRNPPSVLIHPGEIKLYEISSPTGGWSVGTTFVAFSNKPYDYERGMYAGLIVTDPPFIYTYWWVILLAVVVGGPMLYFLVKMVRRRKRL